MRVTDVLNNFNEIACEEIRAKAIGFDKYIDELMKIVVVNLGISEGHQKDILKSKNVRIASGDKEVYENTYDGGLRPGKEYIIAWYFNLQSSEKRPRTFGTDSENDLLAEDNLIYFKYTCSHYVSVEDEIIAKKFFNFTVNVKGMDKTHMNFGRVDKGDMRVGLINEMYHHYHHGEFFEPIVVTDLILLSKEAIDRYELFKKIVKTYR